MSDNRTIIHCCIDKQTYEMLKAHCDRTGQTKTTAVKRAIQAYCDPMDNNVQHDEKKV